MEQQKLSDSQEVKNQGEIIVQKSINDSQEYWRKIVKPSKEAKRLLKTLGVEVGFENDKSD